MLRRLTPVHPQNFRRRKVRVVDVEMGPGVELVEPVNLYGCRLGKDVFVGPFTEIQAGVEVGNGVRIQSHTFICSDVTIGAMSFIGHGVMFINDKFVAGGPARGDVTLRQKTRIGTNVSIGSNSTILPVSICDDVVIGAGSVVTKNITEPGVYAGNPAKKIVRNGQ